MKVFSRSFPKDSCLIQELKAGSAGCALFPPHTRLNSGKVPTLSLLVRVRIRTERRTDLHHQVEEMLTAPR